MKRKTLTQMAFIDCAQAMWSAIIFYAIQEILTELILVYTAKKLGEFTNTIFYNILDIKYDSLIKLFICVGLVVFICPIFETIGELLMFHKSFDYCNRMYERFIDKKYESLIDREDGELQYRLDNDIIQFYLSFTDIVIKSVSLPLIYLFLFYNSFRVNVEFTAIVIFVGIFCVSLKLLSAKKKQYYLREQNKYSSEYKAKESEYIENGQNFIFWNIFNTWKNKINSIYDEYHKTTERKYKSYEIILSKIIELSVHAGNIAILVVGAILVSIGKTNAGVVTEMLGYYNIFIVLNERFVDLFSNISGFNVYLNRILFFYEDSEIINDSIIDNNIPLQLDHISFEHLSCGYGQYEVINDFNGIISNNSKVILKGKNGSGKTTLINTLCRIINPIKGKILVNGVDQQNISLNDYRNMISVFTQDQYFFEGTVKDNIKLGNLNSTEEEIASVASILNITDLLNKEIHNNASNLSGGERQKVGLARALLKHAPLLVLDEPENNLDIAMKDKLCKIIKEYIGTVIVVTHYPEFITFADKIIEL